MIDEPEWGTFNVALGTKTNTGPKVPCWEKLLESPDRRVAAAATRHLERMGMNIEQMQKLYRDRNVRVAAGEQAVAINLPGDYKPVEGRPMTDIEYAELKALVATELIAAPAIQTSGEFGLPETETPMPEDQDDETRRKNATIL